MFFTGSPRTMIVWISVLLVDKTFFFAEFAKSLVPSEGKHFCSWQPTCLPWSPLRSNNSNISISVDALFMTLITSLWHMQVCSPEAFLVWRVFSEGFSFRYESIRQVVLFNPHTWGEKRQAIHVWECSTHGGHEERKLLCFRYHYNWW